MMLAGAETDLSHLLPRTYKSSIDHRHDAVPSTPSNRTKLTGVTLTPELAQQKLQTPRVSRRMSAFTSPNRRVPTTTALAEGELSFFTRVTDTSSSSNNDSFQSSIQYPPSLGTPRHTSFAPPDEYISPATTPAKSETDLSPLVTLNSSFTSHPSGNQFHTSSVLLDMNSALAVAPTVVTPVYPNLAPFVIPPGVQPIHLVEQQHEQLLLQREQQFLQFQQQKEFSEEQQCQEYAHQKQEELLLQRQLLDEFKNEERDEKKEDVVASTSAPLFSLNEPLLGKEPVDQEQNIDQGNDAVHNLSVGQSARNKIVDHPLQNLEKNDCSGNADVQHSDNLSVEPSEQDATNSALSEMLEVDSTRYYSSPTGSSSNLQKQFIDRIMATTALDLPESKSNHEPPAKHSKYRDDRGTPRISNSTSVSDSSVSSQTDAEEKYHLEPDHNWSAVTVDAMKATMSRALGKLQTLASHITATNTDTSLPEALNTSTESSSASPIPDNASSKSLDFQDLANEIRGIKGRGTDATGQEEKSPSIRHRRRDSTTSFDTLGAPKPASLANTSSPPRYLQKPIPLNPTTILPKNAIPLKKSDRDQKKTGPRYISPPASNSRTRAVTPIVRMRNQGKELEDSTVDEFKQEYDGMNFKSRSKMSLKLKTKPVRKIHDTPMISEKPKQKKKSKTKTQHIDQEESFFSLAGQKFQVQAGIPTCKNDIMQMLERFMSTRCGNLDDAFDGEEDDEDYSMDSNDLSYVSEEDEASEREIVTRRAKPSSANVSRGRKVDVQKDNEFSKAEPKYSITVDLNDKQFIRQFIASVTTEGVMLIRHKLNHRKSLRRPTKNLAFIKRGIPEYGSKFKGPRFVWKEINGTDEGELDLFDICSLEKATALELENYPLAMPGRSMFFRTHKGVDYVFEARNVEEALRFVHGMRWLIARLAFNLIIGNVSVSCELLEVERNNKADDCYGMFPSTLKEESQWTNAMNTTTSHLVSKASSSA